MKKIFYFIEIYFQFRYNESGKTMTVYFKQKWASMSIRKKTRLMYVR